MGPENTPWITLQVNNNAVRVVSTHPYSPQRSTKQWQHDIAALTQLTSGADMPTIVMGDIIQALSIQACAQPSIQAYWTRLWKCIAERTLLSHHHGLSYRALSKSIMCSIRAKCKRSACVQLLYRELIIKRLSAHSAGANRTKEKKWQRKSSNF